MRQDAQVAATTEATRAHRRAIRLWLNAIAALLVLMVMVGGATRLTDSGLSIVEWRPVTGVLPPVGQSAWMLEFEKYKTSSEYELANKGMTLEEFKRIYWWEWAHRLLGRLIGAAFLLPLLIFQLRGFIEPGLKRRLWLIFALGALQGAIGWWMVASGLVGRVDVAQERLAIHLTTACLILIAVVWTARDLARKPALAAAPLTRRPRRLASTAVAILALLVAQIALGGLVAGLKAGLIYDTWPLIDGAFIPSREHLLFLQPAWTNLTDNHLTVQFTHRMLAYLLLGMAALHAVDCAVHDRASCRASAIALALVLVLQAVLGILTLVLHVSILLALMHQLVAILALITATVHVSNLLARRMAATAEKQSALTEHLSAA